MPVTIRRALIAVADKSGLAELAAGLARHKVELISTGGTAAALRQAGAAVREVAEVTGVPEMLGGRVKTLHPRIHGGILARREVAEDLAALRAEGIAPIDLVVVNLYPFEETAARGASFAECIEQIDIGGPALIRAAAKNHRHVCVVVDPRRYGEVLEEMARNGGAIGDALRRSLAAEAFRRTAAYDLAISNWFGREMDGEFPEAWSEQWRKVLDLRYGENPHQKAAWYRRDDGGAVSLADACLSGDKPLSYNNLLDVAAACECALALAPPAAVIVKHCLPCGAAERAGILEAFEAALEGDRLSSFGGVLALNSPFTVALARRLCQGDLFFEVIWAPASEAGAIEILRRDARWGKNCRVVIGGAAQHEHKSPRRWEIRSVLGGLLLQDPDVPHAARADFKVASRRAPSESEWRDLLFAWRVIPFARSNAIALAKGCALAGIGAGPPSRVDAVQIACRKAGERARGAALASDAFFPFPDGVEEAAKAGVTAVIHPGGSLRDAEVLAAAERAGLAVVLTGERHFKH